MDREHLARLLESDGETFALCHREVLAGSRVWVSERSQPAPELVRTYARRERLMRRQGTTTPGFTEAVDALRAWGDGAVRLGSVTGNDPPYHFQLFLDEQLTRVVACLGVDQQGHWFETGDQALLNCEIVQWMSRDFPGWVRARFADATGRVWSVVDKVPIFGTDLAPDSPLPVPAAIRCIVLDVILDEDHPSAPPLMVVSTTADGVASANDNDRFTVGVDMLRPLPPLNATTYSL